MKVLGIDTRGILVVPDDGVGSCSRCKLDRKNCSVKLCGTGYYLKHEELPSEEARRAIKLFIKEVKDRYLK